MDLPNDIAALKQIICEQQIQHQAIVATLQTQITELQAQVAKLQQLLFGKKSERRHKSQSKLNSKNNSALNGRRPLPDTLKRVQVEHDLKPEEQICTICHQPLHRIGAVVTDQLDCEVPQLYVKQHTRYKYACRHCQGNVVTASLPEQPIAKGLAGSGLLASVLIDKYEDALPLYRQEQRWQRLGYALTRSTLCDWVNQCAERLKPIVVAMQAAYLLVSPKIHSDDTSMPVLAPNKTHRGSMWTYVGGDHDRAPTCIIYQYAATRSQAVPFKFLKDYQGYVQADAYPGYNACYASGKIIEVGCWAHTRRKFIEAEMNGSALATEMLAHISQLYVIEQQAKNMTNQQRYHYRRCHAKPLLKNMQRWLRKNQPSTLPKSPLGKALQYCLNHWQALNNYLRDGCLAIDNNIAERAIKPLVIGRKNYLFAGSQRGAENAAIIYSIIQTCKALGINTYDYLKTTLDRLPTTLMKNIADLFPHNWQPTTA